MLHATKEAVRLSARRFFLIALLLWCCLGLWPSPSAAKESVVVYTSVDQVYSEPVLRRFSAATGIRVQAVYDVEAAKTVGLVNRILAEKGKPRADVFWNHECQQTLALKHEGVLAPYRSPAADGRPADQIDPEGFWTGFGGRARILLANTARVPTDAGPRSVSDLAGETARQGRAAMAYPLFGTTATHAAALYALWGREAARRFFEAVKAGGVAIVPGNAAVRDLVASGRADWGLTDTDDACEALSHNRPVAVAVPDQAPGGMGVLVIPNTVALVAGGPHPEAGRRLVDYLLSPAVEQELAAAGWVNIPSRSGDGQPACSPGPVSQRMALDMESVLAAMPQAMADLREIFVQ